MTESLERRSIATRVSRRGLAVSIAGCVALIAGGLVSPAAFFRAYLFAWLLCLSASVGGMTIVMLHHLTGGRWGFAIRRLGEAAAGTMPFIALAFLPLIYGARFVFPWADVEAIAASATLRHRQPLFNPTITFARAAIFLTLWSALAWLLCRASLAHDRTGDLALLVRLRRLSAGGAVLLFVTMSLASVDWIASREVDWYSSTFGLLTILGQTLTGLSLLLVALRVIPTSTERRVLASPHIVHDLANLLQTLVVLWAYVSFMQYLIIWSGNSQEDIRWFHHRTTGIWNLAGITLIVLHFGLPFVILLFRSVKRRLGALSFIAGSILVMRVVDGLWTIAPSSATDVPGMPTLLDPLAVVALGGLWWMVFIRLCAGRPLIARAANFEQDLLLDRSHVPDAATH